MEKPDLVPLVLVKNDEYWLPYVLEASRGFFNRYVIYDVGSTDRTPEIIDWFVESEKHRTDFLVRQLPHVEPAVQGTFRNSMIGEARSDYYLILDADEIYTKESFEIMLKEMPALKATYDSGILYGIVPRVEISRPLDSAYGLKLNVPHHRLYHRSAVWQGPHPGEWPVVEQKPKNERWLRRDCVCWHFHGTDRSLKDHEVPKRLDRRKKGTYTPGTTEPINLLDKLPILRKRIEDFAINPFLEKLQANL